LVRYRGLRYIEAPLFKVPLYFEESLSAKGIMILNTSNSEELNLFVTFQLIFCGALKNA